MYLAVDGSPRPTLLNHSERHVAGQRAAGRGHGDEARGCASGNLHRHKGVGSDRETGSDSV